MSASLLLGQMQDSKTEVVLPMQDYRRNLLYVFISYFFSISLILGSDFLIGTENKQLPVTVQTESFGCLLLASAPLLSSAFTSEGCSDSWANLRCISSQHWWKESRLHRCKRCQSHQTKSEMSEPVLN